MNAGDRLRSKAMSASALAALAVRKIVLLRDRQRTDTSAAYLLRSLKHPDEIELLRHVYGESFFAVGVVCGAQERREVLSDTLSLFEDHKPRVESLIARDQADPDNRTFGQNVRDTYEIADAYVPGSRGSDVTSDIDRFLDTLFGAPFVTPRRGEEAMFFAHGASLRSAAAGRQVGATLIPVLGTPIVAGVNEVPRPGGGQYWEGDLPDFRDFQAGRDPNPNFVKEILRQLLERMAENGWLTDEHSGLSGPELLEKAMQASSSSPTSLMDTRISDLIEFTRCLHAEQAAIINAARAGVSTQGAYLYTTTFPCHECAKMIVGAGIAEVHYIEPYSKSLVDRLFGNEINTSPELYIENDSSNARLPFYQYTGIAPRWYGRAFLARERRIGDDLVDFVRSEANPRTTDWSRIAVEERESSVIESISDILQEISASDSTVNDNMTTQSDPDHAAAIETALNEPKSYEA